MLAADPPSIRAGGGIRTYHVAKALADQTRLTLAVLLPGDMGDIPADLVEKCAGFHQTEKNFFSETAGHKPGFPKLLLRLLPWLAGSHELLTQARRYCAVRPEQGSKYGSPRRFALLVYRLWLEIQEALAYRLFDLPPSRTAERLREFKYLLPILKTEYPRGSFDAIWIEHSFLFPYVPALVAHFGPVPVICNAHNVEYDYHRRMAQMMQTASSRRWWLRQSRVMKKSESGGFDHAALTFCCSAQDAELIKKTAPKAKIEVLPNGVDTAYFTNVHAPSDRPSLVFTGGMSYAPNQDAVEYFADEILPHIRESIPDCRFVVAGSAASGRFADREASDPLFEVASDVPDIRPYIGKAWVVVVPLRVGSGTRLKILEAMAMGKAVVSTELGAEGLEVTNGKNIVITNAPMEFAEHVVSLLQNPQEAKRFGERARELACEYFGWEIVCKQAMSKTGKPYLADLV